MRVKNHSLSYLLALSLSLTCLPDLAPVLAQTKIASAVTALEKVRTIEGITEYKLPNGMKVLLFPDSSKPTVTVNVTYLVGSRMESYGETGMAHLLEHLMFKGTPTFPNVPKVMQERGADFNATTWYDRTTYYETMPASDANLEFGLKLEADRMVNSFIQKSDLDSEMTVVRNEFEAGENNPSSILEERVFSTAYLWHNYGRSTIGARSDIENVPISRLQNFYRKYYQPDNAILVVAGNFDATKVQDLIQKYFGTLPKPTRVIENPYTEEPAQDGEREVSLRRVGQVQVLGMLYHLPQGASPDAATSQVLDHILTNSPSGRLYTALVKAQQATRISGNTYLLHDPGAYYFSAEVPKDKSLAEVKKIADTVIQAIAAKGVTEEEMKRAKLALGNADTDLFNNSQELALQLAEWTAMGDWRLFFINRDRVQKVTAADVQKLAQTYFTPVNRTLGFYYPTEKPERVAIATVADVTKVADSYVPSKDVKSGEVFDISAENLLKRSQRSKLPNGLVVTLIPKANRGETVVVDMDIYLGTADTLASKKGVNALVAAMLNRGTTKLTRQQLADQLNALNAKVSISGSANGNSSSVSIETTRPNLEATLKLVNTMLREPAFDSQEFAQIKQQSLTALDAQRTEPAARSADALAVALYQPSSLFYAGTLDERIARLKGLTLDNVKAFYKTFYGAAVGEVTVVGDFDPKVVAETLTATVGKWIASTPAQYIALSTKDLKPVAAAKSDVINIPDKPNAVFRAALPVVIKETDPQYTALEAGVYIFGGGALSSRFADRVRQKEGYSYGAGSALRTSTNSEVSTFGSYAISNNENAPKVEKAFLEELNLLISKGITPEELKRTQEALIQETKVALADDGTLASTANDLVLKGKTFQELADEEQRIRALTVDSVNAALRQYINPAMIRIVKAGDLK